MLPVSTGNNITLPAKRSPTTSHTNSTGPSLAQKTGSNEALAVRSGYVSTELGEKES